MTTQVVLATTAFGLATVVAALEDGALADADRRILLVSNNAAIPELGPDLTEVAGMAGLLARFDAVHSFNAAVAPQHPSLWRPRPVDLPLLERLLRREWGLEDDLHLVVESIWVSPALALCQIFAEARIDVYGEGLMSYGPTRNAIPGLVACRVERLLHLDLVPGLPPVLLSEFGVPPVLIATEAFRKTMATLEPTSSPVGATPERPVAILLGQYLAPLGILTAEEERNLHLGFVRAAVAAGSDRLVFKPHPSAPLLLGQPLVAEARRLGAELVVHDPPELVEPWFRSGGVGLVVGCFSTALATAAACYDIETRRVGTRLLLRRLRPYANSNRVPVAIIHATTRAASTTDAATAARRPPLAELVRTVSYCMQPARYPGLRPEAERVLADYSKQLRPYVPGRRLAELDLPLPPPPRRADGPARRMAKRVLGPRLSREVARQLRRWRAPRPRPTAAPRRPRVRS